VATLNPLISFLKANFYLFTRRLHFPRHRVNQVIKLDGEDWVIFREAVLDPRPGQPRKPGAIFRPRFHVVGMSLRQNIWFSLLPIPFIVGLPGFRSKLWLYNQSTSDFQGLYEWDTVRDAENYARSFAMDFMTRRSVPGSVSSKIISTTE
jgi:hypothetical protein